MVPKPNVRVEGGGATGALALRTAFAYIKGGLCDSIIVYGGETNGKSVTSATAQQFFALSSDADWEMMVGGTYTAYYAAMIREHMRLYGTTERQFAHIAVKNRRNAHYNPIAQKPMDLTVDDVLASAPVAEPYKLLDCSLLSDGAAALILATEEWAANHSTQWSRRPVSIFWLPLSQSYHALGDPPQLTPQPLDYFGAGGKPLDKSRPGAESDPNSRRQGDGPAGRLYSGVEYGLTKTWAFANTARCPYPESGALNICVGRRLPFNTSGGLSRGALPVALRVSLSH